MLRQGWHAIKFQVKQAGATVEVVKDAMQHLVTKEYLTAELDRRFSAVVQQFREVDKQFAAVDKQFNDVDKQSTELKSDLDRGLRGNGQEAGMGVRVHERFLHWLGDIVPHGAAALRRTGASRTARALHRTGTPASGIRFPGGGAGQRIAAGHGPIAGRRGIPTNQRHLRSSRRQKRRRF